MKEYINGNVKEIEGKYGKFINCSIKLEELQKIANDRGYCNFILSPRREVGRYGETHSIIKNDWTPERGSAEKKEGDAPFTNQSSRFEDKLNTGSYGKITKQEEIDINEIPF